MKLRFLILIPIVFISQIVLADITIDKQHQKCAFNYDCTVAYTDCSTCECGTPVTKVWGKYYKDLYKENCSRYEGAVCEMACPQVKNQCIEGYCAIVEVDGL